MQMIKNFIKHLCAEAFSLRSPWMKAKLQEEPLIVADIGATGGPEARWSGVISWCHFLMFDPDPRVVIPKHLGHHTVFPVGLWSEQTRRDLIMTRFPSATTVCNLNCQGLQDFLNAECHDEIGRKSIELISMTDVLKEKMSPDFIKTDAEGADLEILRGADRFLDTTCLGVQAEVSFFERHKKAALFSDVDQFLRERGFFLAQLYREHWIRKNGLFGPTTKPQLIWGNAVYILSKEVFLQRCRMLPEDKRETLVVKFLAVLLVYHMHDYAEGIRLQLLEEQLIKGPALQAFQEAVAKTISSFAKHFLSLLVLLVIGSVSLIVLFPFAKFRPQVREFCKTRLRQISTLLNNYARGGPCGVAVSDFEQ